MTLRKNPRVATWFLKHFGSQSTDETVIGDLTEQYQRGQGSIWYWRQVLAIVVVSHVRNIQRDKWNFLAGLFRAWCVYAGLYLFQLLVMSKAARSGEYFEQTMRYLSLTAIALGLSKPLAIGTYIRRASRTDSRTILLAFIASYAVWDAGRIGFTFFRLQLPASMGFGVLTRYLTGLLITVPLMLLAGIRSTKGSTPLAPRRLGGRGRTGRLDHQ